MSAALYSRAAELDNARQSDREQKTIATPELIGTSGCD
jgi:hypothetical protein